MKASTIVFSVFLFASGVPLSAKGACTNPNSILNATYGWEGHALGAAGNTKAPKIGDFVPSVQVGHLTFDGNGHFSGAHDTSLRYHRQFLPGPVEITPPHPSPA